MATATAELVWLTSLLHELRLPVSKPPLLLCDNVGATYLCSDRIVHSKMKHISMDYHFVCEQVRDGKLQVSHVSTKDQLADLLNKPLAHTRFNDLLAKPLAHTRFSDLRSKMQVTDGNFILRGCIGYIAFDSASRESSIQQQ